MANPEQTSEPSMEEILASIRKIISDDDDPAAENGETPPDAPPEAEQDAAFEAVATDDSDVFDDMDVAAEPATDTDVVTDDAAADLGDADVFEAADDAAEADDVLALSEDSILSEADTPPIVTGDDDDIAFASDDEEMASSEEVEDTAPQSEVDESAGETEDVASEPVVSDDVPVPVVDEKIISRETDAAVSAAFGSLANVILSNNARTLEDLVKDILKPMLKGWLDENLPPLVERLVREEIERVSRGRK